MANSSMTTIEEIKLDITESAKLGIFSKIRAKKMLAYVDAHPDSTADLRDECGMRISEVSDLISQMV